MQPHPRYQVIEKLASGSFATVYRGRDLELGREVAIKQIHEQYLENPEQLERYWQEAQLLASFQHPNIVTIYDIVRDRGWLILELMQSNLSKIAGRKPMDLDSLRSTLAHCLRALRFLHAHGIVHGDVKPSNLMVDRRKRMKIGDFGLARRVSDDDGSLIKGTTKYMAPEVVTDEFGEVGPASDLYSLGFVAYELLCGENFESLFPGLSAYGRDKQIAWMMWHAAPDRKLPEIRRTLEGVPEDLAHVIQKLTNKSQSERYRSADEALSDLKIDLKLVGETSQDGATSMASTRPDNKRRMLLIGVFCASLLVSLLALFGDSLFGTKSAEQPKGLYGVIDEVRPTEKMLIVRDETGYPSEVPIPSDARFYLVDQQQTVFLKDLKPLDHVLTSKSVKDPRVIDVARPRKNHGKITHIDAPNSEFEMSLEEGDSRESVVLRVPASTKLLLNGKPTDLAGLKLDDRLDVTHIKDPKLKSSRKVLDLAALRTVREVGTVSKVEGKRLVYEVRDGRNVNKRELPLAADVAVQINGETSSGSSKPAYTAADLKPGDRVVVLHDTHVTALEASRRKSVSGTVEDVDPDSGTLKVVTSDSEAHVFKVDNDAEVSLAGDRVELGDLRRFDDVNVTYDPTGSTPPARTVDAVRKPRGGRVAVIVAVQNYTDRNLTRPEYSIADAKLIEETLIKRYSCARERIVTVVDPSKAEMERQLAEGLKRTTNQSQLLVIFCGNAYKGDDGQVYLAAKDTQWSDLAGTGVSLKRFATEIDNAVASERIFLFDGSHAASGGGSPADLKKQFSAEEMLRTLDPKSDGPLLKQTAVIGSTQHGERGQNWSAKGHSLFGWAIADALSLRADTNRNTLVEPQEMFAYLKTAMGEAATQLPAGQTPVLFPAEESGTSE